MSNILLDIFYTQFSNKYLYLHLIYYIVMLNDTQIQLSMKYSNFNIQ